MRISFSKNAWEEYISWQKEDVNILRKINSLIKEIQRTPFEGIGKPEPLKFDFSGFWSRRIDNTHRLIYRLIDQELQIYSCRFHYD